MTKWPVVSLGDVITLQRGFDLPSQNRQSGLIPIVSSSGISGYHAVSKVAGPGVVTGRYGTIGQVFYIEQDFWPLNTTLFVSDFKGNAPRFIHYLLHTLDFNAYSDKSGVPGINRNHVHTAQILMAPLSEQRAIANILGALDDKIELNKRTNETLESIARALFQSWFVNFDPVRARIQGRQPFGMDAETTALFPCAFADSPLGEIPQGWSILPLDETARFLNGLALQKFPAKGVSHLPVIKIAELRRGVTSSSDKASQEIPVDYIVNNGDFLFSWSGSLEAVIWTGGRGALNQHLFKVTSDRYPQWYVYQWVKEHLPTFRQIAASKATTMGHIQRHHLHEALVLVPPPKLLDAMTRIMAPLLDKTICNSIEGQTLVALRDMLLPKLMSGEVCVRDVENTVEAVI